MRPPGRDTFGGQAVRSVGRDRPGHHRAGAHSRGGQPRSRGLCPLWGPGRPGRGRGWLPRCAGAGSAPALGRGGQRRGTSPEGPFGPGRPPVGHNVLHRAGEEGLRWLQGQAGPSWRSFLSPLCGPWTRECIRRNISPGAAPICWPSPFSSGNWRNDPGFSAKNTQKHTQTILFSPNHTIF